MLNKIAGQQSPSEWVRGGRGVPGFYTWASDVKSFRVFFAAG